MHSDAYTFRFAAIVTIVCSVLLAGAATLLKPRQIENEQLDMKKNILLSAGILSQDKDASREEITDLYQKNVTGVVLDSTGNFVQGKTPGQLDEKKDTGLLPLYEYKKDGKINAYILPVSGKGLWSTIYGYIALDPMCGTVEGITFYKHGETPGLGGEISKPWFSNNFKGKKIYDDQGNLVSVSVVKGKVAEKHPGPDAAHYVDGISGATLTGRGVTHFLKTELEKYKPFFDKVRSQEGGQ